MGQRIDLYDPEAICSAVNGAASDLSTVPFPSDEGFAEEARWRSALKRLAEDPRGPTRPVFTGTSEIAADVADLDRCAPHFAGLTRLVRRAVVASVRTQTRLRVPPILILGDPGLGKTRYVRDLCKAFGEIHLVEISLNLMNERGRLTGYSSAWRGARTGDFARGLLSPENRWSGPIFFLDEIDKVPAREQVHDALLSVLEPENARRFVDEYLTSAAMLRLDHALIFATANDLSAIPEPLLDRMVVIRIEAPAGNALRAVALSVYADVVTSYGSRFAATLHPDALAFIETMTPRRMTRVIDLAVPIALERGRHHLSVRDLEEAARLLPRRPGIGFVTARARSSARL